MDHAISARFKYIVLARSQSLKPWSMMKTSIYNFFYLVFMTLGPFLGPRGPLVLPSVGPVPSVRAKNLDHLYTGIYAL